jgi:hypothetical protein
MSEEEIEKLELDIKCDLDIYVNKQRMRSHGASVEDQIELEHILIDSFLRQLIKLLWHETPEKIKETKRYFYKNLKIIEFLEPIKWYKENKD